MIIQISPSLGLGVGFYLLNPFSVSWHVFLSYQFSIYVIFILCLLCVPTEVDNVMVEGAVMSLEEKGIVTWKNDHESILSKSVFHILILITIYL